MPYRVKAYRGGASSLGPAEAWAKKDGKPAEFPTMEAAKEQADKWNYAAQSGNVHYVAQEVE